MHQYRCDPSIRRPEPEKSGMAKNLDLLLLGATGFSGTRCVPYLYRFCNTKDCNLTWGIAGRSETKLKKVLKDAEEELGTNLQHIPVIIVDITDQKSLDQMVRMTKVVINCCGPFRFLGEPVVRACISAGTHHVDISAEPQFMEKLEVDLKEEAKNMGVYVVTACGFDCLPADLGVVFLQKHFGGTLNSVNTYLEAWLQDGDTTRSIIGYNSNSVISSGTWDSLVHCVANFKEIVRIREQLFPEFMSKFKPELKQRYMPHHSGVVDGWSVPLPTADGSSIKRTQKYFYETEQKRPIQASTYFNIQSFFQVFLLTLFAILLYPLTRCKLGVNLLLRYPALFTLGVIRKTPPSDKVVRNTWYQVTLYGEGWTDKVEKDDFEYQKPCDRSILGRVKGRDGYELTCIGVILSAIVLVSEKEKLPTEGGVFSAGACFSKTSLIEKLQQNGVEFQILHEKPL